MNNNNLLTNVQYDEFCQRGDHSIVYAKKYYQNKDFQLKEQLIKYNMIDCEALMNIVHKLRDFC